ncbi:MAG TPA: hypothetical protein PK878_16535 [bacterium]|nr:hypothetical protein [Candidatus Omnitrophota bacterium]HOJ61892.1 hypothetical protein [bacterium]
MNGAEFVVEFTKAYATLLSYMWWPLVFLIIFFSLLFYVDRTFGAWGRRRRFAIPWSSLKKAFIQLERHHLPNLSQGRKQNERIMLVQDQLERIKQGIERRDENEVMKAILMLSYLAQESDQQLAKRSFPDELKSTDAEKPELVSPARKK